MEIVEARKDKLASDEAKVCGEKYTITEFCEKFWVTLMDTPAPSPGDIVRANRSLSDLYWAASKEKVQAQTRGSAKDVKLINVVLDNLDFCRKCLNTMTWARSLERKVGLEN